MSIVKSFLPRVTDAVKQAVDDLNVRLLNGTNFLFNVFDPRFPLNLTTTQPPTANNETNVLTMNFDGTFYDTVYKTNHVDANDNDPDRIKGLNSNQFFLHQTMLSSAFMAIEQEFMPVNINDSATAAQLL